MKQQTRTASHHRNQLKRRKRVVRLRIAILIFEALIIIILIYCFYISKKTVSDNRNNFYASDQKVYEYKNSTKDSTESENQSDTSSDAYNTFHADSDLDLLILVNAQHTLPENYQVAITQLRNNQSIATICYPDLQAMIDDCRAAGLNPLICSSYRSMEKQQTLFTNEIQKQKAYGYDEDTAYEKAATIVAIPGTSEHQLGLALDIVDISNQRLEEEQENTPVQQWLMANSWKYGFILRYPKDKSDITGIIYEPWHYRYVGKEAAKYIYEHQLCLEEYLELD